MPELREYLATLRESCPEWLANIDVKNPVFNREDFFKSRVVFYPGAYVDGHAIKLFGSSHAAHCFVYCDFLFEENEIKAILDGHNDGYSGPILGYHPLVRIELRMQDLVPQGWIPHSNRHQIPTIKPYGFLEILERNPEFDDQHGAQRLAVLFLGSDGHATYDALFCQNNGHLPPFCLFLRDHGFGGNYSDFGNRGLMHEIAMNTRVLPEWLVVSTNTNAWNGYQMLDDVNGEAGGMHADWRRIYKKTKNFTP